MSSEAIEEQKIVFWVTEDGFPVAGFEHEGVLIGDPKKSPDGQFGVDPEEAYGIGLAQVENLRKMNTLLVGVREWSLAAMRRAFVEELGLFLPAEGTAARKELEEKLSVPDAGMARATARALIQMLVQDGTKVTWYPEIER